MIDYFLEEETIKCTSCGTISELADFCPICHHKHLETKSKDTVRDKSPNGNSRSWHSRIKNTIASFSERAKAIPVNKTLVSSAIISASLGTVIFWQLAPKTVPIQSKENIKTSQLQQNKGRASPVLNYGGSLCLVSLFQHDLESAINFQHQFKFQPNKNQRCSLDLKPLLSGQLTFVYSSRPLTRGESQLAEERGLKLSSIPFATDAVVPFVNPRLNINHLTVEQLRGIFSGRITNWQEVGGPSRAIVPIVSNQSEDLTLLMGDNYTIAERAQLTPDYTTAVKKVSTTPGAISLASVAMVKKQESALPIAVARNRTAAPITALLGDRSLDLNAFWQYQYPLTRSLFIIVPTDKRDDLASYISFLRSPQGQQILTKNGLIPLVGMD